MEALKPLKPSFRSILKSPSSLINRSGRENTPPVHPNVHIDASLPSRLSTKLKEAVQVEDDEDEEMSIEAVADDCELIDEVSHDPSVKVVVRVRPATKPQQFDEFLVTPKPSSNSISVGDRSFMFDSVLGPQSTQEDVFELIGVPLVRNSLAGFNTSIISYGESGSGKTYTMWGPPSAMVDGVTVDDHLGIAPRIFDLLFSEIQKREKLKNRQINHQCRCSFLEVYNDRINDLLDPTQKDLQIRDDARNGFQVVNLTDEYVTTSDDVIQLLVKGLANRKVGATSVNTKSSRSHIIFTFIVESWCKETASKCFSNSRTSRISLVDIAGVDKGVPDDANKQYVKEEKHIKKSLSKLGKLVNVLGDDTDSGVDPLPFYAGSCLTLLLHDILGGNAKLTVLCNVCPDNSSATGTLSTLRFAERASLIRNKAVINQITEDDVNGLSDQIRQLKEELIREKLGERNGGTAGHFRGRHARESLNLLRVSLCRTLAVPASDTDSDQEASVDEEDVQELYTKIGNLYSSSEDLKGGDLENNDHASENLSEINSSSTLTPEVDTFKSKIFDTLSKENGTEKGMDSDVNAVPHDTVYKDLHHDISKDVESKLSPRKSILSISPNKSLPVLQDPSLCSSPTLRKSTRKSTVLLENERFSACNSPKTKFCEEPNIRSSNLFSPSLRSSKINPTESLAVSLQRGLQIIDHQGRNSNANRSVVDLSFEQLAFFSCQATVRDDAGIQTSQDRGTTTVLCSQCRNTVDLNESANTEINLQIIPVNKADLENNAPKEDNLETLNNLRKREMELELLCAEQEAKIKHLTSLVSQNELENNKNSSEKNQTLLESMAIENNICGEEKSLPDVTERENLLVEIQNLKEQLKSYKDAPKNDSLLDYIRNGGTSSPSGSGDFEQERERWMEAESKWICLTEELRVDLDTKRRLAEAKELELNMEKKCTAELDDALQRSIIGHAKIVEHYAELQENYSELLLRYRKVMEGIAEVKKAAAKAGGKGSGSAFAAALAAELSTLRIDREKERAYLKEQNRRLRIQLRDTAEAVHAAGELLVRLREAEAAASHAEEKYEGAKQEIERMKKQMEKQKKKHAMELTTMKHFLAESRLPESALEPIYLHEIENERENRREPATPGNDESWRDAFQPSYH